MTDQSFQFPRFFVTAPAPCPYLPDQQERKVFTDLTLGDSVELHEALGRVGFRRSQTVAYRPACENCAACVSVRVLTQEFEPSRGFRRIIRANRDLIASPVDPVATDEQYELVARYLAARHNDGGMSDMAQHEFAEMVETSPVATTIVEYREPGTGENFRQPGKLVAAALTDVLSDGLSMIYSFFDTESVRPSLGTYLILDHIERTRKAGLPHVYLGYWVEGSPKMEYKARFRPLERLTPTGWQRFEPA